MGAVGAVEMAIAGQTDFNGVGSIGIVVSVSETGISASKKAVSDAETVVFRIFVPVKGALRN